MLKINPLVTFIIMIGSLLLGSCSRQPVSYEYDRPEKFDKYDVYFHQAEEMYEKKVYDEALNLYNAYISKDPSGPLGDDAVMKIGAIHFQLKQYRKSRQSYQQLIERYPDSPYVHDAKIEILTTYYMEEDYQTTIELTSGILIDSYSKEHLARAYIILGDTYMAVGSPVDAVYAYTMAYDLSGELDEYSSGSKLKQAISKLNADEVSYLLNQENTKLPKEYLLFQMGYQRYEEDRYEEAQNVFKEFLSLYPMSENADKAKKIIMELENRSVYNRYKIGCLLPLSGPYSQFGNRALRGIELALKQFSYKAPDVPVTIVIKDSGADPEKTRLAMRALIDDRVAAIIGPIITAETAALESQNNKIPIITLSQKDDIPSIGDYVFRNFLTSSMQVKEIVSFAVEKLGISRFAILYPDENYGKAFMNLFWDEVSQHDGKIVGIESYDLFKTDFIDPIKKLVGLYYKKPEIDTDEPEKMDDDDEEEKPIIDFEAIFIPDAPKMVGLIIPQLAFYDITNVYLLGTNLWHSTTLIDMSKQFIQGAVIPDGFFEGNPSENVMNFVRNFREIYKEDAGFLEAVSYDSAMILLEIISQEDIRFRSSIRQALLDLNKFEGVTGPTSFYQNGEPLKNLYLLSVEGEKFIEFVP